MTVNSIPAPIDPTIATAIKKTGSKTMGSEDFMKLLAVQFKSQDPMKPMEDTAFIAQMAQFTSLSQTQTMTSEMLKLSSNQQIVTASNFLGKQVTLDNGKGGTTTGNVDAVHIDTDGPRLVVGNKSYPISSVLYVEPGAIPTPETPADANTAA